MSHPSASPDAAASSDPKSQRRCHPHIHHATVVSLILLLAVTSIGLLLLGIRSHVLLVIAGSLQLVACVVMTTGVVKSIGKVYRGGLLAHASCIVLGLADIVRIAIVGPEPIARNPVSHSGFGDANGVTGTDKQAVDTARGPWVASMIVNGAVLAVQAVVVFILYRHYDVLVRKFVEKRLRTLERRGPSPYDVVVQAGDR